jgi:PKD repeat protein
MAPSEGTPVYSWDFGDETTMRWGEKVTHTYAHSGRYTVTLYVRQGKNRESVIRNVTVYDTKGILVSDSDSAFENVVSQAGEHGIWLDNIVYEKSATGFSSEEEFIRQIQERIDFVKEAKLIVFQTKSVGALQSFAQFWQKLSDEKKFDLKDKLWVQMSDGSLDQVRKLVQPLFSIIKPNFILLTRPESFNPVFEQTDGGEVIEKLKSRGLEFRIIDQRSSTSPLLVLSNLTTYFVANGISQNVIYLLLAVPFIVFVIAFLRQFVGIAAFGVYAPLMLALSFLVLGLQFGFLVFLVVMLVSYLIRLFFERVELLYIPKVSLLLSVLALSFFLVLGLAVHFNSSVNLTLAIFPMLVMATLSEKFLSAQSMAGIKSALITAGETILVALLGYSLVTWGWLEGTILSMPEIILLPMLGIIWLGRFTGLRLTEYFKFRTLFHEETHEEE